MTLVYAPSTGGFYDSEIHGHNVPHDAVEVTKQEHAGLLAAQSAGQIITSDANGRPLAVDPPLPPPPSITQQILDLESTITPRRAREALLTEAGKAWLADVDSQIAILRAQINEGN